MNHWLAVLDRDGIINVDYGYVHTIEKIEFVDGIFSVCHDIQKLGGVICVATNQSGIARGFYSQNQFDEVTRWIADQFSKNGVTLANTYFCPHLPPTATELGCSCRKPNPGMLLQAMKDYGVRGDHSLIIGDKPTDVLAGTRAGFRHRILVGYSEPVPEATESVASLSSAFESGLIHRLVRDFSKPH
jgi:D-glycero-D-manno-heptose 1,7-bisphosphate phosphatase